MPGSPVMAAPSFTAGMRTEFLNTYRKNYNALRGPLGRIAKLGIPSDKNQERFFYWTTAPHIKRWRLGEMMTHRAFRGINYTVDNFEWAIAIDWRFTSRQDDQTQSLVQQARQAALQAVLIEERLIFRVVTATADNDLGISAPNGPDGQALYSTTNDGTTARFGVTNGNALSGSGVANNAQIRTDFFTVMSQFRRMQDTQGQPLFNDGDLQSSIIYFDPRNEQVFREAFVQSVSAQAATTATSNAGVTNVITESGYKVTLVPTQRVTNNNWYVFLDAPEVKPLLTLNRQSPATTEQTFENSDSTKETGIESFRIWMRMGVGVNEPYATIRVAN